MSGNTLEQAELDTKIAWAKAEGFKVIIASETKLLLDLDHPWTKETFRRQFPLLKEKWGAKIAARWKSKSGRGEHVVVELEKEEWSWSVRYAMEMALGSDPTRGLLAIKQMQNGCNEASILFKPTFKSRTRT